MKRRILALCLVLATLFSLIACTAPADKTDPESQGKPKPPRPAAMQPKPKRLPPIWPNWLTKPL